MYKQNVILLTSLLISLFIAPNLFAQSFSHSLGASAYLVTDQDFDYGGSALVPAATYSPRFNFYEGRGDFSVSIGTHLGIGAELNSRSGGYFIIDAPVLVEANFGQAAYPDTNSGFGGFIGGGFKYANLSGSSVIGPLANAGVRFMFRDRSYTIRASYLFASLGENSAITDMASVGLFYNFGDY